MGFRIYSIYKTSVQWGAPCLDHVSGPEIDIDSDDLMVVTPYGHFQFKLIPLGEKSSMGYGYGDGYSDSGLLIYDSDGMEIIAKGNVAITKHNKEGV